jgi:hypothetical protein
MTLALGLPKISITKASSSYEKISALLSASCTGFDRGVFFYEFAALISRAVAGF